MPKRTLYLIIVLVLVAVGLFWIALATTPYPQPSTQPNITPRIIPPVAQTVLLFDKISMATNLADPTYSLPIIINTQKNLVTGVQLELFYDPQIITNVSITQGPFFSNPVVLLNHIDSDNGRISYALGINPEGRGKKGEDIIATLTFRAKIFTPTPTTISFLPKTLVTAEGVAQSVLKSTNNLTQFIVGKNVKYTR